MGERIKISPLSGFPEWNPAVRRTELRMLDAIRQGFELHGFLPIETPAVERMEVLTAKGGIQRQIYSLRKPGEGGEETGDLGLHFDLTVPLARYVAQRAQDLTFPFRRYQMQKVWRGERAQRGRFREFYQCDVDIIGSGALDPMYDAEVASVIASVFRRLGLSEFTIRLSNRKVLSAVLSRWGIEGEDVQGYLRLVDKHGSRGAAAVTEALQGEGNAPPPLVELTGRLLDASNLDAAESLLRDQGVDASGVTELRDVEQAALRLGVAREEIEVDLAIARGLDYYTGTVYETFLRGREEWGSVCSGGRYDDLAGYFTDRPLPGVGVSIGLTRLLDLLVQNELIPVESPSPTQVLVAIQDRTYLEYCLRIAATLRSAGISTEVYMQPRRLGDQLSYASSLGVPWVAIVGASEAEEESITLRNLGTGQQEAVPLDQLVPRVSGN